MVPCPGGAERRGAAGCDSDATHCRFEGARFFVRIVVGSRDELAGRAGRGRMIGSMTKDVVGAAGIVDGIRTTEISYCVDGGAVCGAASSIPRAGPPER